MTQKREYLETGASESCDFCFLMFGMSFGTFYILTLFGFRVRCSRYSNFGELRDPCHDAGMSGIKGPKMTQKREYLESGVSESCDFCFLTFGMSFGTFYILTLFGFRTRCSRYSIFGELRDPCHDAGMSGIKGPKMT